MRSNNRARMLSIVAAFVFTFSLCFGLIWAQTTPAQTPVPTQPAPAQPAVPPVPVTPPRPAVVIDAAHGGSESGAVLSPVILEKDINLELARRLRQDLTMHGVLVQLIRDADVTLSTDDRAAEVNAIHPLLYICLHASSERGGIKIFSAMFPQGGNNNGPFVEWNSAQSASLGTSRSIEQQLGAMVQKSGFVARALRAPLQPLNNVTVPALGVEISPTSADVSELSTPDYQQDVSTALADAIAGVIPDLNQHSGAQH